ncbi:hypothetical protein K435DRAFT_838350 [Dendrothele bispora CBS 962.96]|uniref:G-protein coupled receptors family 2 profile 2 domain-containing protein n=1 Tax=Dendrothele bispora (strain CBS 962.96) TaxID=1314807 RepID=A0A4S8M6L3_DENBC|nr:hypothetical protein K435DRAFT_838350 [Dendrothele bispora CBS 962.96]
MPLLLGAGTPRVLVTQRPPDESQLEPSLVKVFIAFQMVALVGSLLTFITAFSSSVRRHPTWYNFLASWIISCISYSLLFFGGELNEPKPSIGLCMTQASLIYAAPPFTAATTLGLVVQIWFTVRNLLSKNPMIGQSFWTTLILALPWLLWCGVIAESVGFALSEPSSIRKTGSGMYCNTGIPIPGRVSAVLAALHLIPAVIIEVLIFLSLRKNWAAMKQRKNTMSMIIRVFGFSVFGVFALALSLFFVFTIHHGADLNIVVATIPVAAVLIFGSQSDLLNVYMFWKRKRQAPLALPPTPLPEQSQNDIEKDDFTPSETDVRTLASSPSAKSMNLSISTDLTQDTWQGVKKLPPLPGTVPEDAQDYDLYSAVSPSSPHASRVKSIRKTLRPTSQQSLLSSVPWRFSKI